MLQGRGGYVPGVRARELLMCGRYVEGIELLPKCNVSLEKLAKISTVIL